MMSIDRTLFLQTRHRALLKIVEHSPTKNLIQPSCKIKETFNDVEKGPAIVPQNKPQPPPQSRDAGPPARSQQRHGRL